jgi:hypothetical protein
VQCIGHRVLGGRLRPHQRSQPEHAFDRAPERHLARDQQAHAGRAVVHGLAQARHVGELVLGVVEPDQHRQRRQRGHQRRAGFAVAGRHTERRGDRAGQRVGAADFAEFHPAHAVRIRVAQRVQHVLREQRLAHAAAAHEADEPVAPDEFGDRRQFAGSADQRVQFDRQVGPQPWRRVGRRCRRGWSAAGRRAMHGRIDARDEPIAAPRNGGDHVTADHLAQRAHLRGEVVLVDDDVGPHQVHQIALRDQPVRARGERRQHVEGARTERGRHAVDQQPSLARLQFETTEAQRLREQGRHHPSPPPPPPPPPLDPPPPPPSDEPDDEPGGVDAAATVLAIESSESDSAPIEPASPSPKPW